MKVTHQDFFLSHSPDLIGRLFKNRMSGDNEHRISIFKMDKFNTQHFIDVNEAFLKAIRKLSKGKMGERTSVVVKSLTLVRGESGRMFVTRGETISICLVDYISSETVEENETRLKESYDFIIKIISLILKWGKDSKPGAVPKIKFPLPVNQATGTKSGFINYPGTGSSPAVFSHYSLGNAGGFNINIEGHQYSGFLTNKNGEIHGHLDDLIAGLETIDKGNQVYQMVKLSKDNPSHYISSSPTDNKGKDGKKIPAIVINFDNTKTLNKVLFAGYPETIKDLITKLNQTKIFLLKEFKQGV